MMQPIEPTPDSGKRPSNGTTRLPHISIVVGRPHDATSAAVQALQSDPDLFTRDTDLVHVTSVTREDQERDRACVEGAPKIHTMTLALLRARMCRWATWDRTKATKDGFEKVPCEPTRVMAEELRDGKEWAGLRPLVGIAETPFPRPDGTIVQGRAHYDAATGYLYEPGARFLSVDDCPTREDARRAYASLADLFSDFPFANSAGVSAAVALLLTLIARPAIKGPTPAWIVDATTPGTGKTLLADVCAAVAFGRPAGLANFPSADGRDGDAELQKRIGMFARMGLPMVNFDNADETVIGGDSLELCISAKDRYLFRILGVTDGMNLPMRIVFVFTGNNASWSRGMNRRILHVRLESTLENPERRPLSSYKHPERAGRLYDYALEHRAEYVKHALTLLRAYFTAERPDPLTLGTFEAWAALIPSAIVWAGGEDPMLCRPSQSGEESPETLQRQTLVREWASFCKAAGVVGVTAHDIIARLYPPREHGAPPQIDPAWDTLRGAIEFFVPSPPGKSPDPAKLGALIAKRFKGCAIRTHDAPAPLQRFTIDGKAHGGRARWKIEPVSSVEGGSYVATPRAIVPSVDAPPACQACGGSGLPSPKDFGPGEDMRGYVCGRCNGSKLEPMADDDSAMLASLEAERRRVDALNCG